MTQFRIEAQPPTGRVIRTINLDTANEHESRDLVSGVTDTDLVLMIVGAGNNAHAAEIIGEGVQRTASDDSHRHCACRAGHSRSPLKDACSGPPLVADGRRGE